ncbi:hypothetical protein COV11_04185 [Candidatus Woesearchaeota archaeon CG10_big_fil_rev_8_21_14_0_10_30_7]|nr:MAG: hypothetical protein COV11_04185 [Candidatus Woesearchaeota archaeon CG10_big_fil_rev_8_21_14_0_10_30_7]
MIKYYLIGEVHGTNECPKACLDLLVKKNIKQLALEFGKNLQPELDAFLNDELAVEDLTIFKNPEDTRASKAMRDLIQQAKEKKIKLYFIDTWYSTPDQDKIMAENLMEIEGKVAYFCGAAHASKRPICFDSDSILFNMFKNGTLKTCGSFLPEEKTTSYRVDALEGGEIYNQQIEEYITGNKRLIGMLGSRKFPIIIHSRGKRYDYTYLVKQFTPSINFYKLQQP